MINSYFVTDSRFQILYTITLTKLLPVKHLFIFALLMAGFNSFSQKKEVPDYGKIDKSDLEMKECDIDKDAEAYKLLDLGTISYERGKNFFRMRFNRRIRIKILKEKGIEEANVKLMFYSKQGYENITDISGITYNLDAAGNTFTTKLEKGSIYTKKIDNQFSEVAFTLPQVKVGCVIEFRYDDVKETIEHLKDWYFQADIPTRLSKYNIVVPSIFKFVSETFTYLPIEQKSSEIIESMGTADGTYRYTSVDKTFTLHNVPALRSEPFMGARQDYLQRIQFNLSEIDYADGTVQNLRSTWPKLTEELLNNEDFGQQLGKNIPKTQELTALLKNESDDYKKMVIIHDYIRRNMNVNDINSLYSMDGLKSAWDKKIGNVSEINLLLINLLKSSGLTTYPLLVSTRDHGMVNTFYPFLQQFNEVMAYVNIGDKNYVLNAADKYNPSRLTPYDILNTEAYIVDKTKGGWVSLNNNSQRYSNTVSIFADIDKEGMLDGEATIKSSDYAKNPRMKKWKEDKTNFNDYFTSSGSNIKIDSVFIKNGENDTLAFEQKLFFKSQLNSSGDYRYFNINLFTGLEKNPFVADERHTDIDFGYKQFYAVYGNITIPEGYKVEELPKSIKMLTPDSSIILQRLLQLDDSGLHIKLTVDFLKPFYPSSDYPDIKEYYKKLFSILNEQVVLKKSVTK